MGLVVVVEEEVEYKPKVKNKITVMYLAMGEQLSMIIAVRRIEEEGVAARRI